MSLTAYVNVYLITSHVRCRSTDSFGGANSSHFWFPSISIPTGIPLHVAQHITLAGDGGACPAPDRPDQSCEQIMLTRDGGVTYAVVKRVARGTSGSFNGYGDLGTHVPSAAADSHAAAKENKGGFQTIVACNDCAPGTGGSVARPAFLQTWAEVASRDASGGSTSTLQVVNNQSVTFSGTPAAFNGSLECALNGNWRSRCGLGGPSPTILRLRRDGSLLAAFYGLAADGPRCSSGTCRTIGLYKSVNGLEWEYAARIDQTANMTGGIGPSESSMAELADGRLLLVFRQGVGAPLYQTYSHDGGRTWQPPTPTTAWAVWPQLLRLTNGALVLTAGRPGIGLWVSPAADGAEWVHYDLELAHNANIAASRYNAYTFTNSSCGPGYRPPPWQCTKTYPKGSVWYARRQDLFL